MPKYSVIAQYDEGKVVATLQWDEDKEQYNVEPASFLKRIKRTPISTTIKDKHFIDDLKHHFKSGYMYIKEEKE